MGAFRNLKDQTFGQLLVIEEAGRTSGGGVMWRCRCDCGLEKTVSSGNLTSGHTKSCGCIQRAAVARANTTHKQIYTKEYKAWAGMIQRCGNMNNNKYANYGQRGITVCPEWMDFSTFKRDMGDRPPGTSIERLNNDGPYAPWNCVWGTLEQQGNNKRNNRLFVVNGERMTIAQISRRIGMRYGILHQRLTRDGWALEKAMLEPVISTQTRKMRHV